MITIICSRGALDLFVTRILAVVLSAAIAWTSQAASEHAWGRTLPNTQSVPGMPLTIGTFACDGNALSATASYSYVKGRPPTILHGKKENTGFFRVVVSYEVATSGKSGWQKLFPGIKQDSVESTAVGPEHPLIFVSFNMDPFRKWIGIYRYGRIILENGDTAVIALEDLLPTARARGVSGNFKEDVAGGDYRMRLEGTHPARAGDPAVMADVISLGGRLMAEFIYDGGSNGIFLEGTRTLDGDFWPTVSIEVGKSLDEWQKIGTSYGNGTVATLPIPSETAQPIRVDLTECKPFIGDYKYGKLIFSNGTSAVFYLGILDPKS
jgi:hypothetical protein